MWSAPELLAPAFMELWEPTKPPFAHVQLDTDPWNAHALAYSVKKKKKGRATEMFSSVIYAQLSMWLRFG